MFLFLRQFFQVKEPLVILGRWGNHWEKRIKYQVYYD
jgi:hypothetical protein